MGADRYTAWRFCGAEDALVNDLPRHLWRPSRHALRYIPITLSDSSFSQQTRAMSDDAPGLSTSHDPVQNAILLMGPTGTGKSSFITRTTDEYAPIVHFLNNNPSITIAGVLFFFDIRERRITAPTALSIGILQGISGESFYPHVGVVSTMWDTLAKGRFAEFERRFEQLPATDFFSKPMGPLRQSFRFLGDQNSGRQILESFHISPPDVAPRLVHELRSGVLTEETTAAIPIKETRERLLNDLEQIDLRPAGSQVPEQNHLDGGQGGQPWTQRYGPVLVPFLLGIAAWALYPFVVSRPSRMRGN